MDECAIQVAIARYLDFARVLWCHPANEAKRSAAWASKLARCGLKPGVPDVLIFTPPPLVPGTHGAALELKRDKPKGRLTKAQEAWLEDLRACGWCADVAYGLDDALSLLDRWGYSVGGSRVRGKSLGAGCFNAGGAGVVGLDELPF